MGNIHRNYGKLYFGIQVHEGEDKRTLDPSISRQSSFVDSDLRSLRSDSGLEDMNRMESGLG